jgi:hypothetical protein
MLLLVLYEQEIVKTYEARIPTRTPDTILTLTDDTQLFANI